jgi:hypothetical protein
MIILYLHNLWYLQQMDLTFSDQESEWLYVCYALLCQGPVNPPFRHTVCRLRNADTLPLQQRGAVRYSLMIIWQAANYIQLW